MVWPKTSRRRSPGSAGLHCEGRTLFGEGTVREGVLEFEGEYEGQGSATFTFDGDRVQVVDSPDIASDTTDMGLMLDGTYVRQKLPKP